MKKFYVFTMAIALMAPMVVMSQPAGAALLVTCQKPSGSVTFSPGLSTVPKVQTTTFNLPVKGCTGPGKVTSGTSKGSTKGKTKDTCLSFGGSSSQTTTVTITWNNKKTSTAKLATKIVKGAPGVITATVSGKVSAGLFAGKTIKTKVKVTLPKGSCTVAKPLKKATLTGLSPLTIG